MDNGVMGKTLDALGNVTKLAANLTEKKETCLPRSSDDSNNTSIGGQNIQIALGEKDSKPPVEEHIHMFPESRALTSEECELALKNSQMHYELEKSKQDYEQKVKNREWEYRMEQERKNDRKRRVVGWIAGAVSAIIGINAGVSIYRDYKLSKNTTMAQKPIKAEGNVQ